MHVEDPVVRLDIGLVCKDLELNQLDMNGQVVSHESGKAQKQEHKDQSLERPTIRQRTTVVREESC